MEMEGEKLNIVSILMWHTSFFIIIDNIHT